MNSLINGNDRIKRSINSFMIFKKLFEKTELNSQYMDLTLEKIDEATFPDFLSDCFEGQEYSPLEVAYIALFV